MALVQKRDERKNIMYLAVLGVVIAVGIAALFILKPKGTADVDTTLPGFVGGRDNTILTKFDEEIYQTEQFKALRDYLADTQPIQPVNAAPGIGNPNPFRNQ